MFLIVEDLLPGYLGALVDQAYCTRELGRIEESERMLAAVLATESNHPWALMQLGIVRQKQGRHSEAISLFRELQGFEGLSRHARAHLVFSLQELERPAEAADELRAILADEPENVWALRGLGDSLLQRGDITSALPYLEKANALGPAEARHAVTLARRLLEMGQPKRANAAIEVCVSRLGFDADLVAVQIEIAHREGNLVAARALVDALPPGELSRFPLGISAAILAFETGRLDAAAKLLDGLSAVNIHEQCHVEIARGQIAEAQRDVKSAQQHFETAVALVPSSLANYFLARQRIVALDFAAAREFISKWIEANKAEYDCRGVFFGRAAFVLRVISEFSADLELVESVRAARSKLDEHRLRQLGQIVLEHPRSLCASTALIDELLSSNLIITRPDAISTPARASQVPKLAFQFWDRDPPEDVRELMQTWRDTNPEYEYLAFDLATATDFMRRHCDPDVLAAFENCRQASQGADIFRLAHLKVRGGVYIDADERCLAPLRSWLGDGFRFATFFDQFSSLVMSPLAAAPEHPVIARALSEACAAILSGVNDHAWVNGPGQLTRAFAVEATSERRDELLGATLIIRACDRGRFVAESAALHYKTTDRHWLRFEAASSAGPAGRGASL